MVTCQIMGDDKDKKIADLRNEVRQLSEQLELLAMKRMGKRQLVKFYSNKVSPDQGLSPCRRSYAS